MTHELIKGIVKTITDGLKDANMQYDYAEEAKEHGEHELAMLHINEAKKRLDGVKEWYDKGKAMMPEGKHSDLEEILICHYKHWYRELKEKVESFHKA
jgi:hypothetical protein